MPVYEAIAISSRNQQKTGGIFLEWSIGIFLQYLNIHCFFDYFDSGGYCDMFK